MWLLYKVVLIFIDAAKYHPAILVFGLLTNIAIGISIASALPWIRNAHHKSVYFKESRWLRNLIASLVYLKDTIELLDGMCLSFVRVIITNINPFV